MRKYLIIPLLILFMILGVHQVQSKTNTEKQKIKTEQRNKGINPNILKVQQITNWDLEISTYFVNEANANNVKVFDEALPLISIETGGTYDFNAIHVNSNGTKDYGIFQINDITFQEIIEQFKIMNRQFKSWDKCDPKFNISAGMYWISYLKDNYQFEKHSLFTSYHRGVRGAKRYASRCGTYESEYSKEVIKIRNEMRK